MDFQDKVTKLKGIITAFSQSGLNEQQIATRLNFNSQLTTRGNKWTRHTVYNFMFNHKLGKFATASTAPSKHAERIAELVMSAPWATSKKLSLLRQLEG